MKIRDPISDNFPTWRRITSERNKISSIRKVRWKLQILR